MTPGAAIPPALHPVPFASLAATLARVVDADAFPNDPPIAFIPADRPVSRLGFALEPMPGLADWVGAERIDAIFLHRPWLIGDAGLPAGVGILASHAAFDTRLAVGSHRFAAMLEMRDLRQLGDGAPGMVGVIGETEPAAFVARVTRMFGGVEEVVAGTAPRIRRIAVVGAMTDALVRRAAELGADLYLTGQIRHPARRALADTGMAVIGLGHRRSEEHALRTLAGLLADAYPGRLTAVVHPGGAVPA